MIKPNRVKTFRQRNKNVKLYSCVSSWENSRFLAALFGRALKCQSAWPGRSLLEVASCLWKIAWSLPLPNKLHFSEREYWRESYFFPKVWILDIEEWGRGFEAGYSGTRPLWEANEAGGLSPASGMCSSHQKPQRTYWNLLITVVAHGNWKAFPHD